MNQQSFELRVGLLKQMFECAAEELYLAPISSSSQRELGVFGVQLCAITPEDLVDTARELSDDDIGVDHSMLGAWQVAIRFVGIKELLALRQEMLAMYDPCAESTVCYIDQSILGPSSLGSHPKAKMN